MSGANASHPAAGPPPADPSEVEGIKFFHGLSADQVRQILSNSRRVRAASGQLICRQGEQGASMFILLEGRVKVSAIRSSGAEELLNYLGRGDHFGEVSLLVAGPRMASVTAVIDCDLLELDRAQFHAVIETIPQIAASLSRSLGTWLHAEGARRRQRRGPLVFAVVRTSDLTASLPLRLAEELARRGETVDVYSDRPQAWSHHPSASVQPVVKTGSADERVAQLRREFAESSQQGHRVLIDVGRQDPQSVAAIVTQCEQFWWLAEPAEAEENLAELKAVLQRQPALAQRLRIVWLLRQTRPLAPLVTHGIPTAGPDLRAACELSSSGQLQLRPGDAARLAHRLQGTHLALALGGGGARGLTHVGVLRALDKAGIHFDRIAGASIGALVGGMYAAGFDLDHILNLFQQEMTPPRWLRALPVGRRWFLWTVLRFGGVHAMVRRQIKDCAFEQMFLPVHMVSVDLVTGSLVVRESGDAIGAVLESINLPGLSRPILRQGQALVDGGVLDNLPADVLRQRQAQFVVAVNIASKLLPRFGLNEPTTPASQMRHVGLLETLFRLLEVQQHGLASVGVAATDFLIEPDTSQFPFDDFSRGSEMADVGQAAAEEAIPRLRQMLLELDISP